MSKDEYIRGYDQLGNRRKPKPVIGVAELLIIIGLSSVGAVAFLEMFS